MTLTASERGAMGGRPKRVKLSTVSQQINKRGKLSGSLRTLTRLWKLKVESSYGFCQE